MLPERRIFLCIVPYVFSHYFAGQSFVVIVFDEFFSFGSQKKKWLLVTLDSND